MKKHATFFALALIAILSLGLFAACANNDTPVATPAPVATPTPGPAATPTPTPDAAAPAYEPGSVEYFMSLPPMPITIWAGSEPARIGAGNLASPFRQEVYDRIAAITNTIPTFEWVDMAAQGERAILAMAAGTTPGISVVGHDDATFNAGLNNHIWEISNYIGNFENLGTINPIILSNASQNGNLFGVPRLRDIARNGWYMNENWLDNLGLNEPRTVDELWEVLQAFTFRDPDGNGVNDTYGLIINPEAHPAAVIAWHGGGNMWVEQNGRLVPVQLTPEYEAAVEFIRRGFAEGVFIEPIDGTSVHDAFVMGLTGFVSELIDSGARAQDRMVDAGNPTEVLVGNGFAPNAGANIGFAAQTGFNGLLALGVRELPTEAHRDHALFFLDRMSEPEMMNIINWGLEGVTYYVDANGYAVRRNEADRIAAGQDTYDFMGGFNQFISLAENPNKVYLRGPAATPLRAWHAQVQQANTPYVVGNPAAGYISATMREHGGELNAIINQAQGAFIRGEIDHATFQSEIQRWLAAGFNTVIEEINAIHAEISAR